MIRSSYHFSNSMVPVLAFAIHQGHELGEQLEEYSGLTPCQRLVEEDPYSDLMARKYPNHIIVHTSRFAVDLNRPPARAVYQKPEDAWGLNVRKMPLSDMLLSGLNHSYTAWYDVLKYQIDRMLSFHPFLVVFDFHNYNHRRGGPDAPFDPQIENPDIILGRNNMPEEYYPFIEDLRTRLDAKKLSNITLDVRCDVKFPGGQLSRWLHDNFPRQVLSLSVEFKKIFMNEHSGKLKPVVYMLLRQLFYEATVDWLGTLPQLKTWKGI